jgi:hypothetical protein
MRKLLVYGSMLVLVLLIFATPARAMPDYATRLGEPCATCHISPSGGGLRTVRGQAWVAEQKPSAVPATADALAILGIRMPADMSIYTTTASPVPTPATVTRGPSRYAPLIQRLLEYEGN